MHTSKHAKYNTRNIISTYLVRRFTTVLRKLILQHTHGAVIDLGCGEALVIRGIAEKLSQHSDSIVLTDHDHREITDARRNVQTAHAVVSDIMQLPLRDSGFDLVICTEVLEHLDNYHIALQEIVRISKATCIISVPREPLWRCLNILRFAYLRQAGNTPGHVNHWSKKAITREIAKHLRIIEVISILPWTVVIAEKTPPSENHPHQKPAYS